MNSELSELRGLIQQLEADREGLRRDLETLALTVAATLGTLAERIERLEAKQSEPIHVPIVTSASETPGMINASQSVPTHLPLYRRGTNP